MTRIFPVLLIVFAVFVAAQAQTAAQAQAALSGTASKASTMMPANHPHIVWCPAGSRSGSSSTGACPVDLFLTLGFEPELPMRVTLALRCGHG